VLQIIYAGSAHRDPTLEGVVEGPRGGVVVEQYNLNFSKTGIEDFIPMSRIGPIFGLILIALLLIFIGVRIQAKTEAFKKWAEEKAEAARHLAELQKRTVPAPPLSSLLFVGAVVCILVVAALILSSARVGPPFGW
jgi:predicted transporter